jgi:Lamin Tail Domain
MRPLLDISMPPPASPTAPLAEGEWLAVTQRLFEGRDSIIAALTVPRIGHFPRREFTVMAFENDAAWIGTRSSDQSPYTVLLPSFPLRGTPTEAEPNGPKLSGWVQWESMEPNEGDRRLLSAWVMRLPAPLTSHLAAPHLRTVPPSPPELTETAQESLDLLIQRRTALVHALQHPVPPEITVPDPAFSSYASTARTLYRPILRPAFSRDLSGGGPAHDQPDGIIDWFAGCPHPVITEVCASNHGSLLDPAGKAYDWIELYNPTSGSFSLTGWHLHNGNKTWTFPTTLLASGTYLLIVYAAGLGGIDPARPYHTNFKFPPEGGTLTLTSPDMNIIESCPITIPVTWVGLGPDWSYGYGIGPEGILARGFFTEPTPGGVNGPQLFIGQCEDPTVELWSGPPDAPGSISDSPINRGHWIPDMGALPPGGYWVRLKRHPADPVGTSVHYTTNNAEPSSWSSFTSSAVDLPLTGSTVIRCYATGDGCLPSKPYASSMLFRRSVLAPQSKPPGYPSLPFEPFPDFYSMDADQVTEHTTPQAVSGTNTSDGGILFGTLDLPIVSLSVAVPEFFSSPHGLLHRPSKNDPDHLTIPGTFEWFAPGSLTSKRSLTDFTLGSHKFILEFGHDPESNDGRLKGQFFPTDQTTRNRFDALIVRSPDSTSPQKACHDLWMTQTQQVMGLYNPLQAPRAGNTMWHRRGCRLVHVFLNGLYWGLSHLTERMDNDFWASRMGVPKEFQDFESANQGANLSTVITKAEAAIGVVTESAPAWIALNQEIEIDQFIDYLLLTWYSGELPEDESSARLVRWKPNAPSPTNDHAWRFFTYDPENAALIDPLGNLPVNPGNGTVRC